VYFKEAKQHLGFLKEQNKNYGAYIASIHLTAIRFCMLVTAKSLNQEGGVSDMRQKLTENATSIDYATRLWPVFQSILSGALNEIKNEIEDSFGKITQTIDKHIQEFFMQTLQLNVKTMRLEVE
jgi:hypothetical protein